jgi:peptidyl-tRNA hydrolase, PTH1 family
MTSQIKLVVGLGNPGKKYEGTRHNMGRWVVEKLEPFPLVRFFEPGCFMNESGREVAQEIRRHGFSTDQVLMVLDDFEIPLGKVRIRSTGSDGGHNGLKSVLEWLQTQDVPRVRLGIGPVPPGRDPADFVLEPFSSAERKTLEDLLPKFKKAVATVVTEGLDSAMNKYNNQVL